MQEILNGALVSGGLIVVAIGAQNAFVLKMGLQKNYAFWVSLICFLCDFVLMSIGVLGVGAAISESALLVRLLSIFGFVFLFRYGVKSCISAFRSSASLEMDIAQTASGGLLACVLSTLAVTLLNPHVYLDTVVIVGGIAGGLRAAAKVQFLVGALLMSFVWFFGLGMGARFMVPVFKNPMAWRVLEFVIAIAMWWLSFGLLRTFMESL